MSHLYKSFNIKADDSGTISGYFSTYDREPDSYGDVIAPGAFTDTIKARKESGHPFPLCWNHDLDQIIGAVDPDAIEDTEKGPFMKEAVFFDSALAQEKREIVKSGVVYQFSFAYDVLEAGPVELEDGTKANELRKLDLFEISIVPIPANQNAVMTDVKSDVATAVVKIAPEIDEKALEDALEKAGRRNSKKDADAIREAITLLEGVLGELEEVDAPEDGEDEAKANGAPEELEQSNPRKERLLEYIKKITEEVQ
jgi:HK97 family phage prohead protease